MRVDDIFVAFFNEANTDVRSENNTNGTVITKSHTRAKQALLDHLLIQPELQPTPQGEMDRVLMDAVKNNVKLMLRRVLGSSET